MSFLRSGQGEETRSEFGPHPRFQDVYLIPRTSSGYPFTPAVRQLTVAAASGAGIWDHFIHADDIFDPIANEILAELEEMMSQPNFFDDQQQSLPVVTEHKHLQVEIEVGYQDLEEALVRLEEFQAGDAQAT